MDEGTRGRCLFVFFFFNDTATTEIYTLSLHDALPICGTGALRLAVLRPGGCGPEARLDRKSTRLNSSHGSISYAVFCLKKKKLYTRTTMTLLHRPHATLDTLPI